MGIRTVHPPRTIPPWKVNPQRVVSKIFGHLLRTFPYQNIPPDILPGQFALDTSPKCQLSVTAHGLLAMYRSTSIRYSLSLLRSLLRSSSIAEWVKLTSLRTTGAASSLRWVLGVPKRSKSFPKAGSCVLSNEGVRMRQGFVWYSFNIRPVDHFNSFWDLPGISAWIR